MFQLTSERAIVAAVLAVLLAAAIALPAPV